jgi:hypothetical protein
MLNLIYYLPSLALIIFGSSLEIYWYYYRFISDGINPAIAWLAGIVLNLFLIVLTRLPKKIPTMFLIVSMVAYSIFCTSAGQAYNLEQVRMTQEESRSQQEDAERERDRIRQTIDLLNKRYDLIENQKNELITKFEDRYEWKNTLATAENDQRDIQKDIMMYRSELSALYNEYEVQPPDIYNYYGGLFNWSPQFLQTVLQMMLSGFIALMAPAGVSIWPKKKKKRNTEQKKNTITKEKIERWVNINWIGIRRGTSNKILARRTFDEFMNNRQESFDPKLYDYIFNRAIKSGVINSDRSVTETDEKKAVNSIISLTM